MTNPTPHGQEPEVLIDLIDAYAEARHRCGGIYNARTEAARNAVIEALSGVQALSAGPVDAQLLQFYGVRSDAELISAQARHIEKLQAKLSPPPSFAPQRVREG